MIVQVSLLAKMSEAVLVRHAKAKGGCEGLGFSIQPARQEM